MFFWVVGQTRGSSETHPEVTRKESIILKSNQQDRFFSKAERAKFFPLGPSSELNHKLLRQTVY